MSASCTLPIKAVPNAPRSAVAGWLGDALKVKVQAPPVEGRANQALCDFLADELRLPRRAVTVLRPEGRPLFAGTLSQAIPSTDLGACWHFGDMLREFRGDSHTAAWIAAGLDATEIGLLTELYWGLPLKSYSRTRGWSEDDYSSAIERLESRGLLANGDFTPAGRALREQVEMNTDDQMRAALTAIGPDFDQLIDILGPWSRAVQQMKGYPASGPHELAEAAKRR